jgi:hypothetical protein
MKNVFQIMAVCLMRKKQKCTQTPEAEAIIKFDKNVARRTFYWMSSCSGRSG